MDIFKALQIEDDFKRNEEFYKIFDEDKRLNTRTGSVEKLTTLTEIGRLTNRDSKVLEIGAATGVYAIALSSEVAEVTAFEPATVNYDVLAEKIERRKIENVKAFKKSSNDMGDLPDDYYDLVMILGPMYHLSKKEDRDYCLEQAKRVCKDNGHIMIAFLNHDIVPITMTIDNPSYFSNDEFYDAENIRVRDFPFIFFTLDECKQIVAEAGLQTKEIIGVDGFSETIRDKINSMDAKTFGRYMDWHTSRCKKPELLGASNHLLFVCKK